MPNKQSAIKRVRQNERRRTRNRSKRSEMRSTVKAVRSAVETGNLEGVEKLIAAAQSKLGKASKTKLVKKQTAARQVSRLMKAVDKARKEGKKAPAAS